MKRAWVVLMLGLSSMSISEAGEIHGFVRAAGRNVGPEARIELRFPKRRAPYSTTTDARGSYRIYVTESGPGVLTLYYAQKNGSMSIYSTPQSIECNLDVGNPALSNTLHLQRK